MDTEHIQHQPLAIIFDKAKRTGVEPIEMLGCLLEALTHSALMHSVGGFLQSKGAQNRASVMQEVMGVMQLAGRKEPPTSLLATLELMLQVQQWLDSQNAGGARKRNSLQEASVLERRAKAEETLRL